MTQAEKWLRDLDLVKREEFEAVKDMARLAREENEALKARIAALEARLGAAPDAGGAKRPSCKVRFALMKTEGAGNAGCALHPRSRVRLCNKMVHTSIQGSGEHPTFPAQWLYGL